MSSIPIFYKIFVATSDFLSHDIKKYLSGWSVSYKHHFLFDNQVDTLDCLQKTVVCYQLHSIKQNDNDLHLLCIYTLFCFLCKLGKNIVKNLERNRSIVSEN